MTTSRSQGGGFLVGILYGLIASTALYLVLCFIFPVKLEDMGMAEAATPTDANAPEVMEMASAGSTVTEIGAGPVAPDMTAPTMVQPDAGQNNATTVGGAGDTGPVSVASTQISGSQAVQEPDVATDALAVPDIGNGTQETSAPGAESAAPEAPAESVASAPVVAPTELASSLSGPAIEVFAAAFRGDTTKPMLAIVLEDTMEVSLQPLVETGKPFSFALSAEEDSGESARAIRESGFEVVAMIPRSTTRSMITPELIAAYMKNVPVAVAMIDADSSTVMLNRDTMQVVLDATVPSGLGLITYSRNGELIARAQAEQAGAVFGSALLITDAFDDEELIIQALNQAAFVAGTNDRAIVFAKTNAATINGILRWLNSPRAGQLELVPVSVALQPVAN